MNLTKNQTIKPGSRLSFNDPRNPGRAVVLAVGANHFQVQFDDRADTTTIRFDDRSWMDFLSLDTSVELTFAPCDTESGTTDTTRIVIREGDIALAFMQLAELLDARFGVNIWEDYDFVCALAELAAGADKYERRDFGSEEDNWDITIKR